MRQDIPIKKLILASVYFDKLYIIGPTGDQYQGLESINPKAVVEFVKDIIDLPSPDELPKDCYLFILFEQRGKVLISIYQDFFKNVELS